MKTLPLVAFTAAVAQALSLGHLFGAAPDVVADRLIKVGPQDFEMVTENTKLQYRRDGKRFIDVTNVFPIEEAVNLGMIAVAGESKVLLLFAHQLTSLKVPIPKYNYPTKAAKQKVVEPLVAAIDLEAVRGNLAKFTSFYTRYYKSATGVESANWLLGKIAEYTAELPAVDIRKVKHQGWDQFSIVVSIPGQSEDKVVVGAHQDSINLLFPNLLRAPGADDDGSGTVTTLEALRLISGAIAKGDFSPYNTLEFHYYSAEEGGLLGSIDVFSQYFAANATVVGMLQQDMTGYTQGTVDEGVEPHFGLINDYTSSDQNQFIKVVVDAYCAIPVHETQCGYACSDHASALENGYPASFLIESEFKYTAKQIHLTMDTMDRLDFAHIHEHIKLTVGYGVELASARKLH